MTDLEFNKLPAVLQVAITIGVAVASAVLGYLGLRNRVGAQPTAAAREADNSREALERERDQLRIEQADNAVRSDMSKVIEAARVALEHRVDRKAEELHERIDDVSERLRKVEIEQARQGPRGRSS